MNDDPSGVQVRPRRNTPAGRSITFLYGVGLLGSTIQTEPAAAPDRVTAARRFASGDQTTNPLPIRAASGPSSRLELTALPSGRISCTNAPAPPPRGSTNAITSSRDHEGALAAAGVGSRFVVPSATFTIISPGASPIGV